MMKIIPFLLIILLTQASLQAEDKDKKHWHKTLKSGNYVDIAKAYTDTMIKHGRDVYGKKHTPLFVTGMDRKTLKKIRPPFPHVKRKPFMPGWERDREHRGSDLNYGHADPLDQLTLLKIMQKLTDITGEKHYAEEANKTAVWWMKHAQSPIGLYPWGTHTHWNVDKDSGGGTFEYNHLWPFWHLNRDAMHKYAMGLWNHYIADKKTGNFNRHAHSHRHGPSGGMEFPWPGSSMIGTWVETWLDKPDPEYLRAIETVLKRWESLRDKNGHLAPCSSYREWAWYLGYMVAGNRLDDYAEKIADKQPELAKMMRDYGRKNDAAYHKVSKGLLNIKGLGPVKSYLRKTGGFNPDRLDIIGGPWQDRKDYAGFAFMLHERMKRNPSPILQKTYRQAILDTAEIYMSINPEVQWSVWGVNVANAMKLMLSAYNLTQNPAYLHRADHFGQLAIELFLDADSALPKLTSQDNFYEIESVTDPSTDAWMLVALDVDQHLRKLGKETSQGYHVGYDLSFMQSTELKGEHLNGWKEKLSKALSAKQGGIWDCKNTPTSPSSVGLKYGDKSLFLSRIEDKFSFGKDGLEIDNLEIIVSDVINSIPTLAEVKPFNGQYRRRFSGKHREPSTAKYGGFKDVLDQAGLVLVNTGKQTANISISVTYHDSWDDRETTTHSHALKAGKSVLIACSSPDKRFIRRLDFKSSIKGVVKLEKFAFALIPRSKLNPMTSEANPVSAKKK